MHNAGGKLIAGVERISLKEHFDERGTFSKTFDVDISNHLQFFPKEVFYTKSRRNVFRGLHMQVEPHAANKIIHVVDGSVREFLVDLRPNSETYLDYLELGLSSEEKEVLFIPKGIAHGYLCLTSPTLVMYMMDAPFCEECDSGISYKSIEVLQNVNPSSIIMSYRDSNLEVIKLKT
jgi:dTDP-4-dehydrorhamnose 3,5-epimerase/CDP-3, 6-dideoxy-D-glycero-D-glycero-4-hexulose-5-epimerase